MHRCSRANRISVLISNRYAVGGKRDDALLVAILDIFLQLDGHSNSYVLLTQKTTTMNDAEPSCSDNSGKVGALFESFRYQICVV